MRSSKRSGTDDSTARAFVRVGWANLVKRLHRYATGTLRLAAIDAERAGAVEAVDLVNALIQKGLEGSLSWTLPANATDEEIVAYACKKLYGMRSTLRRQDASDRRDDDDARGEQADEGPGALELLGERRGIMEVLRAFEHDAEASAHLAMMLDGAKRAEIVDELRCTPERADVVRKRILRGVTALGARMNDESEDEPPSSGPRGSYHAPQATEERQGEAPEPHRGAGRARRGR